MEDSDPNLKLSELINFKRGEWEEDVLRQVLREDDAKVVVRIPLSTRFPPDSVYKWHTSDGVFTTKSAYWLGTLGVNNRWIQPHLVNREVCDVIWRLNVPPKLKHFLWRVSTKALAVRSELCKRNIALDSECGICREKEESILHDIVECSHLKVLWEDVPIFKEMVHANWSSCTEMLHFCFENMSEKFVRDFMVRLWTSWALRNDKMYERGRIDPGSLALAFGKL